MLLGCNKKKVEPVTDAEESTVLKEFKTTDEFIKKEDYKSIAYAFIYNIKEGLKSYESATEGSLKAKIMFFDYDIKYSSVIYKSGNVFYSKDLSTSTFSNVKNEFYMVDKEKILVSRDLKKYDVYTLEDYRKISYAPTQYTIMGYVFNDESIIKTELVSNTDDLVSVKYTLDNVLATNIVKVDMKINGDLTDYPKYKNIELTLSMKKDFTPISYAVNATYDASKPVVGSLEVKQEGQCVFSKINETITIPNEAFLIEKLGAAPSEVVTGDEEREIKDDLLAAASNLDFAHGVNINGDLVLNLFSSAITLNIDTNIAFDLERISKDKIYELFSLYAKVEGDETFSSLASLVRGFAGEALGEYQALLDSFKSMEVVYDGNGSLYLIPTNQDNAKTVIFKTRLTDIAHLLLKQINVYNIVTGANEDFFEFKKIPGADKDNYQVEMKLNEAAINSVKEQINTFFENETYAMLKTILGYKDFDSIKINVAVANKKIKSADASINYLKAGASETDADEVKALITLHLEATEKTYDFKEQITKAEELYKDYLSVQELKGRVNELTKNIYVNRSYLANLEVALNEYKALTDQQKEFVGKYAEQDMESAKESVNNILIFLETFNKYDLDHLTNEDIYNLAKAYKQNSINSNLLRKEIGDEKYNKLTDLGSLIDYSAFDGAVSKFIGDDETAWGLTEAEIRDIKFIFEIGKYEDSVKGSLMLKLWMSGNFSLSTDALETKINNLYNNLPNP